MICKNCGAAHQGGRLPGSGWIELILWLWVLLPGLIYSIWRRSSRPACSACGSRDLVPVSAPAGRALVQQHYPGGLPPPPVVPPAVVPRRILWAPALTVGPFALLLLALL